MRIGTKTKTKENRKNDYEEKLAMMEGKMEEI